MSNLLKDNKKMMEEYDFQKNININLNTITEKSPNYVFWICKNCHGSWKAPVARRTAGSKCPYCTNRKVLTGYNDLASKFPSLLDEWDYEKNKNIKPSKIVYGSHTSVWWKCSKCGNEWKTAIVQRTKLKGSTGCPECGKLKGTLAHSTPVVGENDLATVCPEILDEWDYEKNKDINPTQFLKNSIHKVWWKCIYCGNSYERPINSKVKSKPGCPDCAKKRAGNLRSAPIVGKNDLKTIYPDIVEEWDYEKNDNLPESYLATSNKKVWWKCKYGHEWSASISNRVKGNKCPECRKEYHVSFPEKAIFYYVSKHFKDAEENYPIGNSNGKEMDIYIPTLRIGIEYDGYFWHRNKKRDLEKDIICFNNNIKLIRVREEGLPLLKSTSIIFNINTNKDNTNEMEKCITDILKYLKCTKIEVDIQRDNDKILELMNLSRKKNSILDLMPEIVNMWDYEKNGNLTPDKFTKGSGKYIWMICTNCGKSYRSKVSNVYKKKTTRCENCSRLELVKGVNDYKTVYPELAKEYDYKRNKIKLEDVNFNEKRKLFWWTCSLCGYKWQTSIESRINADNCPMCAAKVGEKTRILKIIEKEGSLATNYPELAKEWHPIKNGDLIPEEMTCKNRRDVWWKCSKCGYEWHCAISLRTRGYGKCKNCKKNKKTF